MRRNAVKAVKKPKRKSITNRETPKTLSNEKHEVKKAVINKKPRQSDRLREPPEPKLQYFLDDALQGEIAFGDDDDPVFKQYGLIVPLVIDASWATLPLDYTRLTNQQVGTVHSYFTHWYSYTNTVISRIKGNLVYYKNEIRKIESDWITDHLDDYKNKWEVEYAASTDKEIRELRDLLAANEEAAVKLEYLMESYKSQREAASREITRRKDETIEKYGSVDKSSW